MSDPNAPHSEPSMHFATRAVHFGRVSDGLSPVATPLVQGVNFEQPRGVPSVPQYTRYANTPTITLVQKRLASLEGAEAAVCLGQRHGRHVVCDARPAPPRRSPAEQRLDLRRHLPPVHRGAAEAGHQRHLRRPARCPRLAAAPAAEHARHLHRDAGEPDLPRHRPAAAQPAHEGGGHRARGGQHLCQPGELPAARTWCGHRHRVDHEVLQRTPRHARRRRLRHPSRSSTR